MMIIDKNKLYEVYSISDDSFTVGKFIYRDDSIYVFKAFDELGREAGIYTFKKDMVRSFLSDTEYLKKMEVCIRYWEDKNVQKVAMDGIDGETSVENILDYITSSKVIATIMTYSDEDIYTGFVSREGTSFVNIECIDMSNAGIFAKKEIEIENICFIEFNSVENDVLLYAYNQLNN
jgi:hypothetical protein